MDEWLSWGRRTRRWADSTCDDYRRRVSLWLAYATQHRLRTSRVAPDDIERWLDTLYPSPSVRTQAHTAVLAWFDWQMHTGRCRRNPVRDVPRVPLRKSIPRSLDPDAVRAVLHTAIAHGPKWGCYIGLLAYAGLRRAEACSLRWVDIEGADAWLHVLGKGGQESVVPIHERLRPLIVRWRTASPHPEWVFPGRHGPMSVATATQHTRSILDESGFPHATGHWLRHSLARRLVERGAHLPDVMGAMRHASLSSTTIYTRSRPLHIAQAVALVDY